METINFKLSNLTCGACAKIVKNRFLKKIDGIKEIEVIKSGDISIASDSPITEDMIKEMLADTDFKFVNFK